MALDRPTADIEQFPSATPDGEAVPTEIGYPYGTYRHTLAAGASALQTLPAGAKSASFYSDVDCVVIFGNQTPAVTADTFVEDQLEILAGVIVHVFLPSNTFKSLAEDAGTLKIQVWRPWKNIGVASLQNAV